MSIFKCKMCGGTLKVNNNETVGVCEYCGTRQTLPKLDNERKSNLYDRANHFRRNDEFDKAMSIYEQILNEDRTDAESYWSIVLCRYGIEYVEDPTTHKRIPTVNRTQLTSIFDDEDYKSALKYADGYQREIYENEANTINEIQKGILAISQKEEPFDVFICYKETDKNGRRTQDSVLAQELYYELLEEGFKVFFAKITLEDKLGQEYEPYIFAALNSAKVMVVLGTKPEYFNAVWVKNEWSRYLALIKKGENKMLIPAYRDMDPYDLPEEFSHLQAQDMEKLGFMQDLVRGIKKIVQVDTTNTGAKTPVVIGGNANTSALLRRAYLFLEDGDWENAEEYCEKVLDLEPENASAYLGKLMVELKVKKQEALKDCAQPFDDKNNYQKVLRFADATLASTLKEDNDYIKKRNENVRLEGIYASAVDKMQSAKKEMHYKEAAEEFHSIGEYKDSVELFRRCLEQAEVARKDDIYNDALIKYNVNSVSDIEEAVALLKSIPDWRDSRTKIAEYQHKIKEVQEENKRKKRKRTLIEISSIFLATAIMIFIGILVGVVIPNNRYKKAISLSEREQYDEAITIFIELDDYKDCKTLVKDCKYQLALEALEVEEYSRAISLLMNITDYKDSERLVMKHISKLGKHISAGSYFTVGSKMDGNVVATGDNYFGQCDVSDWTDIVSISAGYTHTIGLKSDGTVVAVGDNDYGQCDIEKWKDIVAISAGSYHTVGLKVDGTVVATGYNEDGQCDIEKWKDIVVISAGEYYTIGLKSDGTVVAVGSNIYGECDVLGWTDIVSISAGNDHAVGLRVDGTVVATGRNIEGQCETLRWTDIIGISAGTFHTVGLKQDGTVVSIGYNDEGQCDVENWNLFE